MLPATPPPVVATVLDDLPFHLARASLAFRRFNERTLRTVGLPAQAPGIASVLHALDEQDDCTVASLVERTHLPNSTLTGLLDQLEGEGLLQRARDANDRRSWRIRLTRTGRQRCARLHERHELVMALLAETFSAEEGALLKRLLSRLTTRMRAYAANEEPSGTAAARTARPKRRSAASSGTARSRQRRP